MNGVLLPTTKAQVSGHKFLLRRVEHGVVLGDIRMIHDPLGRRRKALVVGAVLTLLIALGAGVLAILRPAINPGDARIIQADSGALYVRVTTDDGEAVHPVVNLASARLIAGEAAQPARASDKIVAAMPRGIPVGILDAPGIIATSSNPTAWAVCTQDDDIAVHAHLERPAIADDQALLAVINQSEWMVTNAGRQLLPASESEEGRALRRRLGITQTTPRWRPPAEVLNTIRELPPMTIPAESIEVLVVKDRHENERYWLRKDTEIMLLSELQYEVLTDLGVARKSVARDELSSFDALDSNFLKIPSTLVDWQNVGDRQVCAHGEDGQVSMAESEPISGITVAGGSVATKFVGLGVGGIAVDTGHGTFIVSDAGIVHPVGSWEELASLGAPETMTAPWSIIQLLPEGSELTQERALKPLY